MKFCKTCSQEKDEGEFGINKAMKDGRNSKCRRCVSLTRNISPEAREKGRLALQRQRELNPQVFKERVERSIAKDREKNRALRAAASRRYTQRHKDKIKTRSLSKRLRDKGALPKQPCVFCAARRVAIHHPDYNDPLNVLWLCCSHHAAWHRIFVPEEIHI